MQTSTRLFAMVALMCMACNGAQRAEIEPGANEHLERAKRWLNYPINGGLAKIVLGFIVPIKFHHPLPRVIVNTYNLQASYRIPAAIIYPHPESVFKNRALALEATIPTVPDGADPSRKQLFDALERGWNRWDRNGPACLRRAVCEVAGTPLKHNGLIGEIIDVIFTPSPTDGLDSEYQVAQLQGTDGHDCIQLHPNCPVGDGFFDSISMLTPS